MPELLGVKDGDISHGIELQKQDKLIIRQSDFNITYYVLSDTVGQDIALILATVGVPQLWDLQYGAYCQAVRPKQSQTVVHYSTGVMADLWEIEATFTSNLNPSDNKDDPEKSEPSLRWTGESEDERLEKDAITEDPVVNGADEEILVEGPVNYPILEITRFEKYPINPIIFLKFGNKVNSKKFMGAPPGTALMLPIESERIVIQGVYYAKATYRIKFKMKTDDDGKFIPNTWRAEVLNEGWMFRRAPGAKPEVFLGKSGDPRKVNLKADGTLLPPGAPPVWVKFNRFQKVDFTLLGLTIY